MSADRENAMSIELRIPSAGESIQEVQIGQWLKHEGDRVRRDETVVELDTDKASMELPSPSDGILSRIVKQDGEKVAVGEVIALIDSDGQQAPKSDAKSQAPAETRKKENSESKQPAPKTRPATRSTPAPKSTKADVTPVADETVAAPSVRRLLREHHVRAQDVKPTGQGGRLLREDVLRYAEQHASDGDRAEDDRGPTADQSGEQTALKPEKPRTPETMPGPMTQESRPEEHSGVKGA